MCINFRLGMYFHFLRQSQLKQDQYCTVDTYHLKSIQLLLDLLSKEGRQSITCSNFASSIILAWWPGVVELYTRAEADVPGCKAPRRAWQALRITIGEVCQRKKILFSFDVD